MVINKEEVLRYLGYRGNEPDENTDMLIDKCINELINISRIGKIYSIFNIGIRENYIEIEGTVLRLAGKDICRHLADSQKCVLMAATLGVEVDNRIAYYAKTDLAKGVIMDACATAAIEQICDAIQDEVASIAKGMEYYITKRFSPGYGDFSLDVQRKILDVLEAYKKIGLTVIDSGILIPRKSVTAVIGLQTNDYEKNEHKCIECKIACEYRKEGLCYEKKA